MPLFPKMESAKKALKEIYHSKLGEKMKALEEPFSHSIPNTNGFFCRLDGVSFHTFLKKVVKPFDSRITDAMVKTTGDLVTKFNCPTGFTCSDEITLIFPAGIHSYNGRVQKLASVLAGYASARFNHHLQNPAMQWDTKQLKDQMLSGSAFFDGRICEIRSNGFIILTKKNSRNLYIGGRHMTA